jgi:hypothetical protein
MTTSTIKLSTAASAADSRERVQIGLAASNATPGLRRVAPAFMRADEAYYWSFLWQQDVEASMRALSRGEYEEFTSEDSSDVARWLLSVDDDC